MSFLKRIGFCLFVVASFLFQTIEAAQPSFNHDLHLHTISGKGPRTIVCLHGYGGDYRIAKLLKKHTSVKQNLVSFNFPDHGLREGSVDPEKTSFGSINELIPAIYVLKKCVVEKGLQEIDLYGFSAGGGAAINVLAVLNTSLYDEQLKAAGISLQDKQDILQAVQRGIVILEAPLKSVDEVIDLRGPTPALECVSKRYQQNDLRPIDSLRHLQNLALTVVVFFQSPDSVISNRDDALFIERLKKYNCRGTTTAVIADEGGHATFHPSVWESYATLCKEKSLDYTTEKVDQKMMIGIELRTSNQDSRSMKEIPEHWQKFLTEGIASKIPHKTSGEILAFYTDYEGDASKPYSLIIGCAVSKIDEIPAGMVAKTIPKAKYAVVKAPGPHSVLDAWKKVWTSTLKRAYTGDLEVYPAHFHPEKNPEVKLYISLK